MALRRRDGGAATTSLLVGCCAWLTGLLLTPTVSVRAQEVADSHASSEGTDVTVRLYRSWTADGTTVVDGVASVPLRLLGGTAGSYDSKIQVLDGQGTQLYADHWSRNVSERAAPLADAGGTLQESFRFGLKPGRYRVEFTATPDGQEQGSSATTQIDAYDGHPDASDLILADRIERVDASSGGGAWPVVRYGYGIGAAVKAAVTERRPEIYYYLELYAEHGGADSARVTAAVMQGSRKLYESPPRAVEVLSPGIPFTGHLSLAGLPPGDYELVMDVHEAGKEFSRRAPFTMTHRPAVMQAAGPESDASSGYFDNLSGDELESLFGGVGLLLGETQRKAYEELPVDAKRRFLKEFFRQHDPDPLTAKNEFLDEYLQRVHYIRANFHERVGTKKREPWRNARGRIYLQHGPPTDKIVERFPTGSAPAATGLGGDTSPPYEIWFYGKSTGYVYLFADESGQGAYRLMYSNDPNVSTLPDWQLRVGPEAVNDLQKHFGFQPNFNPGTGN